MDKKSLLGLLIIGVILFVFTWHSSKQQAEIARQQASIDSAARASLPVETVASEIDPASPSPTGGQRGSAGETTARGTFGPLSVRGDRRH